MQLKRYTMQSFSPKDYPPPLFVPHKRGRYVLYSDASARISTLEAALRGLLMSADCTWEERNLGHDWADSCKAARQALGDL